jgi:iron complex outermembrane receptor protein
MLRAKFPGRLTPHLLALSLLLAGSTGSWANDASAQEASTGDKLEEIIVTAQKREQNLQDVGASVTAFDAASLQRLGLHGVTDIVEQVPGLQFNQYGATVTVYNLRGVSQNDFNDHQEAPVAVYDDEAYVASTGALAGTMYDLQRVEVLRGPQGTLFGRNATGGLIQYISNKPDNESGGYFDFTRGNYGAINSEGAVNQPLSDTVAARFSFATDYHEGYIENSPGHPVEDQN